MQPQLQDMTTESDMGFQLDVFMLCSLDLLCSTQVMWVCNTSHCSSIGLLTQVVVGHVRWKKCQFAFPQKGTMFWSSTGRSIDKSSRHFVVMPKYHVWALSSPASLKIWNSQT